MWFDAWRVLEHLYSFEEVGRLPYKDLMAELSVYDKELHQLREEKMMSGLGALAPMLGASSGAGKSKSKK